MAARDAAAVRAGVVTAPGPVPVCLFERREDIGSDWQAGGCPWPICMACGVAGCVCEWCDYCQRDVNPWAHFVPDHDYGTMQRHDRIMASSYGTAALPLPGCPPGCWYCTRLAELLRAAREGAS
jgi:hypothetical protein